MFWVRGLGTPPLLDAHGSPFVQLFRMRSERAEVRFVLAERNLDLTTLRHQITLKKKIHFASLELPFKVADVVHPGQVWETVKNDSGRRKERR